MWTSVIKNAPSKPNWDDAPGWAQYLAMDPEGWYWFEHQPRIAGNCWDSATGQIAEALYQPSEESINWKQTLETMP